MTTQAATLFLCGVVVLFVIARIVTVVRQIRERAEITRLIDACSRETDQCLKLIKEMRAMKRGQE
jgi:hypothetical protein